MAIYCLKIRVQAGDSNDAIRICNMKQFLFMTQRELKCSRYEFHLLQSPKLFKSKVIIITLMVLMYAMIIIIIIIVINGKMSLWRGPVVALLLLLLCIAYKSVFKHGSGQQFITRYFFCSYLPINVKYIYKEE